MAGVPFKVFIPSQNLLIGVVASSYRHFLEVVQAKFGFAPDSFQLYLDDGTLICDQEYFELLGPQTKITVSEKSAEETLSYVGEKRPLTGGATTDLGSCIPPLKHRKPSVSSDAQTRHSACLDNSQVAGLAGLRIASVAGSVPMQPSPPPSSSPSPVISFASPPNTSCTLHQDAARLAHASPQHHSQFTNMPAPIHVVPRISNARPQWEYAQANFRQQLMKPPPLRFHGQIPLQLPQWEEAYHMTPMVYQFTGSVPQHPQMALQPLQPLPQIVHGCQRTQVPAYAMGGSARMQQYSPTQEAPRLTHRPASSPTSPQYATRQLQLRQQLASLVRRQLVRPATPQLHQVQTIPNQSVPSQPAVVRHQGAPLATRVPVAVPIPSPSTSQLSAGMAVQVHRVFPPERLQAHADSMPGMLSLVSNLPQYRMESLTYVSVIDIEKEPQNGKETEDEDGGLGLSIVEDESQPSSTPTTRSSSPAFFPLPKSACSPRPSSLTLSGHSAADAVVAEETSAEECVDSPKSLEENNRQKDSSPDDGYCSSSPPASATEKLPFADFDFFQPPTPVQAKSLMEGSQCESKEMVSRSFDDKLPRESYIDKAETELFTFRGTPTKPKSPSELMVKIPVKQKDGELVCKGSSLKLDISIPVCLTTSGRIVCQGMQTTEEYTGEEDESPESPPFSLALDPDSPVAEDLGSAHEEEEDVEVVGMVDVPKPVTVQEYASEELVCTVTHICSEAIFNECVEEIVALANRTHEEQCVKAEAAAEAEYYLPKEEDVVILEGDGGDFVNEITLSESEHEEDDDEVNTADLIKREMELKLNRSESVEKILCLAEQLSPEDSKTIRDFFNGILPGL